MICNTRYICHELYYTIEMVYSGVYHLLRVNYDPEIYDIKFKYSPCDSRNKHYQMPKTDDIIQLTVPFCTFIHEINYMGVPITYDPPSGMHFVS